MFQDLLLNLFTEFVGILITVFVIDRLMKWREERRWLPLKHFVYAQLLEMAGRLLHCILSAKLIKITNIIYEFGLVSSCPLVEIELGLDEVTITDLLSEIEQKIQLEKQFDIELLSKSKQQLDNILDKYAFLVEPELLALLLELERALTSSLKLEANCEDKTSRWSLVLGLTQIALTVLELKAWLEQKASRRVVTEISTEEMLKATNKLNSKLKRSVFHSRRRVKF
ncbi:MAG: hypothetical protein KME30_24450 [Iphinoe sp. HA4291-MV1]|jgi:hypothetical protein|nr:hypothetical protein [Iphinoe sp. HA4291-MV1]